MDLTELQQRIGRWEDLHTEFKECPVRPNDLADPLVAFANTEGGHLILGVNKDKAIIGVSDPDVVKRDIDNISYNNCEPPVTISQETLTTPDGKTVVIVHVPKGDQRPYRSNRGLYRLRTDSGIRPASRQELLRLFQASESLYYDELAVSRATLDDLDFRAIERYLDDTQGRKWRSYGLTLERLLVNLNLARPLDTTIHPTLAGLLFFGNEPQRHVPYAYITAARFPGTSLANNPADVKKIEGTMPTMLEDVLRFLYIYLPLPHVIEALNPETRPELPAVALRELIINALSHRDYTLEGPIRVLIFDDRVEIRSPGKLPNGVTLEALPFGVHLLRNPTIYNLFLRLGWVTEVGSGFPRAIDQVQQLTGEPLTWKLEGIDFVVTLARKIALQPSEPSEG
jgi:ATP-dependent DNA helicase RecG